jgi:hypothetical protein
MEIVATRVKTFSKAIRHPLRIEVLLLLEEFERVRPKGASVSPSAASMELKQPLEVVAYHVDQLAEVGAIVEVARRPVRGAAQHFYSLTDYGRFVLKGARFITNPWPEPTLQAADEGHGAEDDDTDELGKSN